MTSSETPELGTEQAAYAALEAAITAFAAIDDDEGYVPIDAVIVIGIQKIDDAGDRIGGILYYPRTWQPTGLHHSRPARHRGRRPTPTRHQ